MRQAVEQLEAGDSRVSGAETTAKVAATAAEHAPVRVVQDPEAERLHKVAHDLRSPLTALRLQLDLLQRTLHSPSYTVERADQQIAGAERQIERMCQLLAGLVDDPFPCLPRRDH